MTTDASRELAEAVRGIGQWCKEEAGRADNTSETRLARYVLVRFDALWECAEKMDAALAAYDAAQPKPICSHIECWPRECYLDAKPVAAAPEPEPPTGPTPSAQECDLADRIIALLPINKAWAPDAALYRSQVISILSGALAQRDADAIVKARLEEIAELQGDRSAKVITCLDDLDTVLRIRADELAAEIRALRRTGEGSGNQSEGGGR